MGLRRVSTVGTSVNFYGDPEVNLVSIIMQELSKIKENGKECVAILMGEELAYYSRDVFDGIPIYLHNTEYDDIIIFATDFYISNDTISA